MHNFITDPFNDDGYTLCYKEISLDRETGTLTETKSENCQKSGVYMKFTEIGSKSFTARGFYHVKNGVPKAARKNHTVAKESMKSVPSITFINSAVSSSG